MADLDLKGRNVVIAGAAGGLGAVASRAFAAAGASLTLLGREQAKLDEMAAGLELPAERWLARSVDVTDTAALAAVLQATQQKFGRVDVLLNVVGGWLGGKEVLQAERADFESMIAQHLYASLCLFQTFVPPMRAQGWGRVMAISSPNASRPPGKNSPYAVGKAAMEALMLSMAQELKGSGVTANLVLVRVIDVKHEREIKPSEENKGWTSPEEISATLLHLCSEEAGVINGARLALFGEPL
jgi:NAD(P)-dependent dehydrogenase (short-subunit alcohol dehydrogenase family)